MSSLPAQPAYVLPDYLQSPPPLSGVPLGSRDVAAFPQSGSAKGPVLVRLFSEPGAQIYYAYDESSLAADSVDQYTQALVVTPPAVLYAQAVVGKDKGPVRRFAYDEDGALWPALTNLDLSRITLTTDFKPLATTLDQGTKVSWTAATDAGPVTVTVDGKAGEWTKTGLFYGTDELFDVPQGFGASDIDWVQAEETKGGLYLVVATRDTPKDAPSLTYGFDLGISQVSPESFGQGTKFIYRGEYRAGQLTWTRKDLNQVVTPNKETRAVIGDVLEFFIANADLEALSGESELVLRFFATDASQSTEVVDRAEPIFLRTQFDVTRTSFVVSGRPVTVNFRASTVATQTGLPEAYLALTKELMPELEAANQLRLHATGTLPFFYTVKEENGFSGLNTSDRGLLMTVGPNTTLISRAQLLAHELAHYQNARYSQLQDRWLQEGMSEWSAARLLTRHFPPRAVYRFLRNLRFDRYFDSVGGKADDDFRLSDWSGNAATLGYEKSFMFFSILESRLGSDALRRAFQRSVNEPVDADQFARILQQETGQDVKALYPYWVVEGNVPVSARPEDLFKDEDGDELIGLDEEKLGSDPKLRDSDGDGYLDSEELYRGSDPMQSDFDPAGFGASDVALVGDAAPKTQLLRFASKHGTRDRAGVVKYSVNPFAPSGDREFKAPLVCRPPFTLAAQVDEGAAVGAMQSLERKLYVNGVPVTHTYPAHAILPRSTDGVYTGLIYNGQIEGGTQDLAGGAVGDHEGDVPPELAAYDITQTAVDVTDDTLTVTLKTKGAPDPFGAYGDYLILFESVQWGATGPSTARIHALSLDQGAPYWHDYNGNVESSRLLQTAVDVKFGQDLTVKLDKALWSDWSAAAGERMVCAYTQIDLPGGASHRERAGCVTIAGTGTGFTRRDGFIAGEYGTRHQLALSLSTGLLTNTYSAGNMDHYMKLGLNALRTFEKVAGRPMLDRAYWPMHIYHGSSNATFGSAMQKTGVHLTVPNSMSQADKDYLVVEQLARLAMADLLDRTPTDPPYWLQEAFIQWLTASTMYRLGLTANVHAFHASRLDTLYELLHDGDTSVYDDDVLLKDWNLQTLGSDGSTKSLFFVLRLNALTNGAALAKSFGTFFYEIPTSSELKAMLQGYVPAKSAQIAVLWAELVDGSGDPAADKAATIESLEDDDGSAPKGDGIFKFEEEQLGLDPAVKEALP